MEEESKKTVRKKKVPSSQTKESTIMAIEKARPQTSARKGNNSTIHHQTCLFYKDPCYQLRRKDQLIRTVDVTQNIRHFKCSNAKIRVVSSNSKLKREMFNSMVTY
jgi:cytochrome c-type biogenesis protein CcmH/NrfF